MRGIPHVPKLNITSKKSEAVFLSEVKNSETVCPEKDRQTALYSPLSKISNIVTFVKSFDPKQHITLMQRSQLMNELLAVETCFPL